MFPRNLCAIVEHEADEVLGADGEADDVARVREGRCLSLDGLLDPVIGGQNHLAGEFESAEKGVVPLVGEPSVDFEAGHPRDLHFGQT